MIGKVEMDDMALEVLREVLPWMEARVKEFNRDDAKGSLTTDLEERLAGFFMLGAGEVIRRMRKKLEVRPECTVDYRSLLDSYIDNVIEHEGVDFIGDEWIPGGALTEEEWEALKALRGDA